MLRQISNNTIFKITRYNWQSRFLVYYQITPLHCKPIPCNENRVFPVKFSHREIPVMKTGVPAMRTGVPCNEHRFFPVWKTSQGKPCFHYREPLFSLQGPCIHHRESCIHYREFPVRITTLGNPCSHYREWVCSVEQKSLDESDLTLKIFVRQFGCLLYMKIRLMISDQPKNIKRYELCELTKLRAFRNNLMAKIYFQSTLIWNSYLMYYTYYSFNRNPITHDKYFQPRKRLL